MDSSIHRSLIWITTPAESNLKGRVCAEVDAQEILMNDRRDRMKQRVRNPTDVLVSLFAFLRRKRWCSGLGIGSALRIGFSLRML